MPALVLVAVAQKQKVGAGGRVFRAKTFVAKSVPSVFFASLVFLDLKDAQQGHHPRLLKCRLL